MAPSGRRGTIGDVVVIAWNGSSETARTVAFAMPFLKEATDVQVVSVEGGMTPGPSAEDMARSLTRGGIPASWRHVVGKGRTSGETFLDEAMASGADLLVKGAYTQSRLRQMIFGGATRHIIMEAKIPVIMAH
jgi:nucleotide-binding universal stress UspA family protein